jgi:hypothetical protein
MSVTAKSQDYTYQACNGQGVSEWFRNTLDAEIYACEQSEKLKCKFFVYDYAWQNGEVATHAYNCGRPIR